MNEIKMIVIESGAGLKKIFGRLKFIGEEYYEFSEAILLEDVMTEEGLKSYMLPIAPKDPEDSYLIERRSMVIRPFTPSKATCDMFIKATSSLVIPSPIIT